ncbi:MAG: DNA repair protein RecN [Gammaproteobacteria bacterium]|nr:DNA repair protein RecN [Gammaproteobacteria bacterium]NNJ50539.1 DNA repair protein RecN [Gammaproteobacteria bacterium]
MLKHLYIRNFAIIDELELDFSSGMTALTGETGAGKSILLGALNLVLGDRADNDSIKQGAEFAEIVAEFDISALQEVSVWLVSQELNADEECILRRRISKDGRSRAYINSTPVNLQVIRELAEMLIDIHGQHEHQSIMKSTVQRQLLDDFASHSALLESVSNLFVELKLVEDQLRHLQQTSDEQNDRLDLLRFQTEELDALALEEDEYQVLNAQHKRMANAEKLQSTVEQAINLLSEDENTNIQSSVSRIINSLADVADIDEKLSTVSEMLAEALVHIDESVSLLQNYGDNIELDPAQLERVEQRIQHILDLARKHRVEADELQQLHENLQTELNDIDHLDERLEELSSQQKKLEEKYLQACERLSSSRIKAAAKLNKRITQSMQTLGMKGGKFEITIEQIPSKRTASGLDNIEFTVTANAGQVCKPIVRVASGGELARISLAIQMIIANNSRIPTLVFDEVDSGIGGGIAEIVGQHLRILGQTGKDRNSQVICITHLPQVASQAHQHLRVEKQTQKKQTTSQVTTLDDEQRRQEIARMLSGVEITEQSLAHADEMLERAQET